MSAPEAERRARMRLVVTISVIAGVALSLLTCVPSRFGFSPAPPQEVITE